MLDNKGRPATQTAGGFQILAKSPTHQHLAESRPNIDRGLEAPAYEATTLRIAAEPADTSIGRF